MTDHEFRDIVIVIRLRRGETFQAVADHYGMSKQRVWQIAKSRKATRADLREKSYGTFDFTKEDTDE